MICENSDRILQMFSGGRDSLLAACRLLGEGHSVSLITFDNGCMMNSENIKITADRLVKVYGETRVQVLEICKTMGIWREFFLPFLNLKPSEIAKKYGEITLSQFHCPTCRASMYVYSIAICKYFGIKTISDGARRSQGFAIELDPMIDRFKRMVNNYGLELVLPVLDLESDWERKNEILRHGIIPKVMEPQCLLGVPLPEGGLSESTVVGAYNFFDLEILPRCDKLVRAAQSVVRTVGNQL